jgi:anti-sigma-K factor RskA
MSGALGSGVAAAIGVFVTFALAFAVAAAIKRESPNFAGAPIAVVRDAGAAQGRALWAIRLAPAAHEIAVDALAPAEALSSAPAGSALQLWLKTPAGLRSLGLLPDKGRAIIPEMPALIDRLGAGAGGLVVTREPKGGSRQSLPSGPIAFRATLGS